MRRLAALALVCACGAPPERCDLEDLVAEEAGVGAVDCGRGDLVGHDVVMDCVSGALAEGVAFSGIVQLESDPTKLVLRGYVGDGVEVRVLLADFWACTDAGCRGQVSRLPCPSPEVVDGALTCAWDETPCPELVCGDGTVLCP